MLGPTAMLESDIEEIVQDTLKGAMATEQKMHMSVCVCVCVLQACSRHGHPC